MKTILYWVIGYIVALGISAIFTGGFDGEIFMKVTVGYVLLSGLSLILDQKVEQDKGSSE